jgi:hypothetical protein
MLVAGVKRKLPLGSKVKSGEMRQTVSQTVGRMGGQKFDFVPQKFPIGK